MGDSLCQQRAPLVNLDKSPMTTNHLLRLPLELRIHIWSLTARPRLIDVKTIYSDGWSAGSLEDALYVRSSTQSPAVTRVCQEARRYAPYEKAFTVGSNARYIWINFELDMIQISPRSLRDCALQAHYGDVRRLQIIAGPDEDAYDTLSRTDDFDAFTALEEIQVREWSTPHMRAWSTTYEYWVWGRCQPANVHIVDTTTGWMLTIEQIAVFDTFYEWHSFDTEGQVIFDNTLEDGLEGHWSMMHLQLNEIKDLD